MLYEIKIADIEDFDEIQFFINRHWKRNHALALSKELLDFQHLNLDDSKYNFIIAKNKFTSQIDGLMGYIPTYQYDPILYTNGDYWGAIWKVRTDIKNEDIKDIGLIIWEYLFKVNEINSWSAIGISEIAKKIYKISGLELGSLNHYYLINRQRKNFFIAKGLTENSDNHIDIARDYRIDYVNINDVVAPLTASYHPAKSIVYFKKRFDNHPIYKYKFLGIYHKNELISIWVVRLNSANNSSVLRIVDVLGDMYNLPNLNYQLQEILIAADCEYIDMLNYGIEENIFFNIGFEKLDFDGEIVIPNYFEPFEQRNVKIEFAIKADFHYVIFKGDSDQDRPNIL